MKYRLEVVQLPVSDVDRAKAFYTEKAGFATARAELTGRGVEVSELQVMGSPDMDGSKFAFFNDPDGNGWALQEIRARD
jgi:catechol-2,3-dioxygenase